MLGDRPGLGQHLYEYFDGTIPVIGVAKSRFKGASGIEVYRGKSARPLYVTAAGMDPNLAAEKIRMMRGAHRLPTLLKRVDLLAQKMNLAVERSETCTYNTRTKEAAHAEKIDPDR
jgi:deoxyribonuclease V